MAIKTTYIESAPRDERWCAYNEDYSPEYINGLPTVNAPIGWGGTEEEAIMDFQRRLEEDQ